MLLENGALCERDTFQGERCLYNALNDRIRNLLLQYDYSKSTDPLQPLAAHVSSLLGRDTPKTADIAVHTSEATFELHKFVLSARSPYFQKKLAAAPETTSWRMSTAVPTESFRVCIRYLYFGDATFVAAEEEEEQEAILSGIDKLSRQLEIPQLFEAILQSGDRRQARQRRTEEVERGRDQLASWFESNVLGNKLDVDVEKADDVKWDRDNGIFADVLLKADEDEEEYDDEDEAVEMDIPTPRERRTDGPLNGIPIGHFQQPSRSPSQSRPPPRKTSLYPAHRAMLLRSEVLATMFASPFREAQPTPTLPIIPLACSADVLEIVLRFLYTEHADFPLSIALEVLHAADMLFLEKLKQRAALLISTLGNGSTSIVEAENPRGATADEAEAIDIYAIIRSGWSTRVHRLEEFGARYIAYRLESYIASPAFRDLVQESASRIQGRQETDTVELVDDIRYYLSERFRLRFEDAGLDEMMDETGPDNLTEEDQAAILAAQQSKKERASLDEDDEGVDVHSGLTPPREGEEEERFAPDVDFLESQQGVVRTLDGEEAGDEFMQDAMNYQILLGKLDRLMEELGLDG